MPEEPEVETEKLHEAIKEELEQEGGSFLRRIALTTAFLAAFAAVAALLAGATVNEALILKTDATNFRARASDQWSYYQAKGVKAAVRDATAAPWLAAGKEPPAEIASTQKRYAEEQAEIKAKAEEFERESDAKSEEAEHLLHKHHGYADAVALFQVSIALGAMAALTRTKMVWFGSMALGAAGLGMFLLTFLR